MRAPAYDLPDPLPWAQLAGGIAAAEDALARLDERLSASPIREGWNARTHYAEARAGLALDGALVDLEDLVLHDAGMDVRAPTYELVRAHALLRTRRSVAIVHSGDAVAVCLRSRAGDLPKAESARNAARSTHGPQAEAGATSIAETEISDQLAAAFADLDAALARTTLVLDAGTSLAPRSEHAPLFNAARHEDAARLTAWRAAVAWTRALPPTLAAAIALDAWSVLAPPEPEIALGRVLAAALLRERGKARAHLPCLALGMRSLPRERRERARDPAGRLLLALEAITSAGNLGLADHDRWLAARAVLLRKCEGRRSTSRLPALVDFVLARPIVSAGMIAQALDVTPRAAQDLVAELDLRELTGRGRYRAWGVL